ncbi:MAG: hypothetical protein Q9222_003108 [Ikaeria aurantiellina]
MAKREAADSTDPCVLKKNKTTDTAEDDLIPPVPVFQADSIEAMNDQKAKALALIEQIKDTITVPNRTSADHAELLATISRLQLAIESPLETIYRIGHQSWQKASVKIALDLGVFDKLVARGQNTLSINELASICGANAVFLVRIMRVIVALGLCTQTEIEEYAANEKTKIMTVPQGISSFKSWFDIFTPAALALPSHMKSQHYQNPTTSTTSAFASATGSEFWAHLNKTPSHAEIFNDFMATRRQGRRNWYDYYPIEKDIAATADSIKNSNDDVFLVDIGGNRGHDLINLKSKYPHLPGKLILQDLPDVVANASFTPDSGIEAMAHDFFTPQPIKHAPLYTLRAILHDWPSSTCHTILTHIAAAMAPAGKSKLLIAEFILTDTVTALFPATLDIQMMGLHAGMERSESQWRKLLMEAGLEVVGVWQEVKGGEGVLEVVRVAGD